MDLEVKRLCGERGITRYELAKRANMSPSNLYNLLKRPSTLRLDTLKRLAAALNMTVNEFVAEVIDDGDDIK